MRWNWFPWRRDRAERAEALEQSQAALADSAQKLAETHSINQRVDRAVRRLDEIKAENSFRLKMERAFYGDDR